MSNTIYGTPVGTPISPEKIAEVLNPVKTVNGQGPDATGNVEIEIPHTPVKGEDYYTPEERAELEAWILAELAKRGQLKPEFANSVEGCTDTSKLYVLPDGYIYAYMEVNNPGGKPLFTNVLPLSVDAEGNPYNGGKGFKPGYGVTSAGVEREYANTTCTGFIECSATDVIRLKGFTRSGDANTIVPFKPDFTKFGNTGIWSETQTDENGVITITLTDKIIASQTGYVRITVKEIADDAIVTVNEDIAYSEPTSENMWTRTVHAFIPADYEGRIIDLEQSATSHEGRISALEKNASNPTGKPETELTFKQKTDRFRYWERAIYDRVKAFTLEDEGATAITADMFSSAAVYQAYDALMERVNPDTDDTALWYITKTLLGQDEAGYDMYRYDFRMPLQPTTGATAITKMVPKAILISGIHPEWAGIYALLGTMREIATNPDLIDLKRNVHFIVVPMVNAYGCERSNRKNINGIDLARNFEVDFAVTDPAASTYGGTAPLSELAAQYIDRIMRENQDAWFFVSCHNFDNVSAEHNLMWGAAGSKYFANLTQKVIDKLTRTWGEKYDFIPPNIYLGHSEVSAPNGSEGRQAAKYAIQGGTLECRYSFPYHSDALYTAFSQSRATEVYINFLLTAFANFDPTDKKPLEEYDGTV